MMLDIERSGRILEIVVETGLPVWVGISCSELDDGNLIGFDLSVEKPDSISEDHICEKQNNLTNIINSLKVIGGDIFGIMHTSIPTTYKALDILFENWPGPVMAYPEIMSFNYSNHQSTVTISPTEFSEACKEFLNMGVHVIGGCCGASIDHIRKIVDDFSVK